MSVLELGGVQLHALDGGGLSFPIERRGRRVLLTLAVRPVLAVTSEWSCLIDTGFGPADPERREKFRLRDPAPLEEQIEALGLPPPDVVYLSHLHFDHAAGALRAMPEVGAERLRFPDARHVVHEAEWKAALADGRGGDLADRILACAGDVETIHGGETIASGLTTQWVPGHTEGLCLARVQGSNGVCTVASDLVPTRHFLEPRLDPIADQDPERALDTRRRVLAELADAKGWISLYHDRQYVFGRVVATREAFRLDDIVFDA